MLCARQGSARPRRGHWLGRASRALSDVFPVPLCARADSCAAQRRVRIGQTWPCRAQKANPEPTYEQGVRRCRQRTSGSRTELLITLGGCLIVAPARAAGKKHMWPRGARTHRRHRSLFPPASKPSTDRAPPPDSQPIPHPGHRAAFRVVGRQIRRAMATRFLCSGRFPRAVLLAQRLLTSATPRPPSQLLAHLRLAARPRTPTTSKPDLRWPCRVRSVPLASRVGHGCASSSPHPADAATARCSHGRSNHERGATRTWRDLDDPSRSIELRARATPPPTEADRPSSSTERSGVSK
ncbi:hypothetical protein C8Q77DRAFT_921406 [Trametes polyzona]|nr:hypothetical protein C8Q77DRAFT_921406 [Trametes polyzona]